MKGLKRKGRRGDRTAPERERERPHRIETGVSMMSMEMVKLRGWRTRVPFFLDLFCLVLRSVRAGFAKLIMLCTHAFPLCVGKILFSSRG
jgi:hypothetical protein